MGWLRARSCYLADARRRLSLLILLKGNSGEAYNVGTETQGMHDPASRGDALSAIL